MHAPSGGLHVKAALLPGSKSYLVAKLNTNFPSNRTGEQNLPTIQGLIVLCDGDNGVPLAYRIWRPGFGSSPPPLPARTQPTSSRLWPGQPWFVPELLVLPYGFSDVGTRIVLRKYGLTPETDVKLRALYGNHPLRLSALQAGQIDALVVQGTDGHRRLVVDRRAVAP